MATSPTQVYYDKSPDQAIRDVEQLATETGSMLGLKMPFRAYRHSKMPVRACRDSKMPVCACWDSRFRWWHADAQDAVLRIQTLEDTDVTMLTLEDAAPM